MDAMQELYNKRVPRWFKVIRWREWGERFYENQRLALKVIFVPAAFIYLCWTPDRFATWLFFKRPQTQEEFDAIKRKARFENQSGMALNHVRNFEMGQYRTNMPPMYDMAVRRKAYPEYYGNRYDAFNRNNNGVL